MNAGVYFEKLMGAVTEQAENCNWVPCVVVKNSTLCHRRASLFSVDGEVSFHPCYGLILSRLVNYEIHTSALFFRTRRQIFNINF